MSQYFAGGSGGDSGGGGNSYPQSGIAATSELLYLGWPIFSSLSNVGIVDDRFRLAPFIISEDITATKLKINVTTAGAVGAISRCGIYVLNTVSSQWELLLDAGTVSTDTTGIKTFSISEPLTAGTPYWIALVSDGKGSTISLSGGSFATFFGLTSTFSLVTKIYKDGVDADIALPSIVTMTSTIKTSGTTPVVTFGIN